MNRDEIRELDDREFDVDGMLFDLDHNNFGGSPEPYRHVNRVIDSLMNGQFTQAREIMSEVGLTGEDVYDHAVEIGRNDESITRWLLRN